MMLSTDPRNRREAPDEDWEESIKDAADQQQSGEVGADPWDDEDLDVDVDLWLDSDDWNEIA